MKKQYLGDAKDAFKWDYLDFLMRRLEFPLLNILLMLTPDDDSKQGRTLPRLFPAREIWPFCEELRESRNFGLLPELPKRVSKAGRAGPSYDVRLHNGDETFVDSDAERDKYFSGLQGKDAQVVFLDPDVGFEPQTATTKHVKFQDVEKILGQIPRGSLVVVFQHSRRTMSFVDHYDEIRSKLRLADSQSAEAVFWCDKAMLVILGESEQIKEVRGINREYQKLPRPVQMLPE